MIVGQGIPGAKRRVIIADAGDIEVIGVNILRADGRFLVAAGQGAGGQTSDQDQTDAFASFHDQIANRVLAEHGRGDDDADAENDCGGDDGSSGILVFQYFLGEVAGRAFVENLVADNCRDDANAGKDQHVADSLQERLRVPRGSASIFRRHK